MLEKLEILNGELSVKFDSLNTRYTVNMNNTDDFLDIKYEIDKGNEISIFGNSLNDKNSLVVITVYNDKDMMSYYLEVNSLKENTVNMTEDYFSSLEIKKEEDVPSYVVSLIGGGCFLIIIFLFSFLFKNKKYMKK